MPDFLTPRQYNTPPLIEKIPVAIVWATGMVGRRFAELVTDHPYFDIVALTASQASTGRMYGDILAERWFWVQHALAYQQLVDISELTRDRVRLVFSAFDWSKDEILRTESMLAERWLMVVSNNSAHRWTPDVPMMLPEVNHEHLELLHSQESYQKNGGWIVVKPNCSIQSFVPVFKAWEQFGIKNAHVVTEQAISGAGKTFDTWPGMRDNVIPHIGWEELKTETEPMKILGKIEGGTLLARTLGISAICTRVAVTDGHMANVFIEFDRKVTKKELEDALRNFWNPLAKYHLPSSPDEFMIYTEDPDRPQTLLDRDNGNGMSITVGRLQQKWSKKWSFSWLSHNTLRWAAGW